MWFVWRTDQTWPSVFLLRCSLPGMTLLSEVHPVPFSEHFSFLAPMSHLLCQYFCFFRTLIHPSVCLHHHLHLGFVLDKSIFFPLQLLPNFPWRLFFCLSSMNLSFFLRCAFSLVAACNSVPSAGFVGVIADLCFLLVPFSRCRFCCWSDAFSDCGFRCWSHSASQAQFPGMNTDSVMSKSKSSHRRLSNALFFLFFVKKKLHFVQSLYLAGDSSVLLLFQGWYNFH